MSQNKGWNSELAHIWTKMVGPSRPTISEINIYMKHIRKLQYTLNRKVKMLILGSTSEFRDLAFEENFDVTVVDCNETYYKNISREIRHKTLLDNEKVIFKKWQDLNFLDEFDVVIGDLVIGNVAPEEFENFISCISNTLKQNGLFLSKSFFKIATYKVKNPKTLIKEYYEGPPIHPYSAFAYDLTIYSLDENNLLEFKKQYDILKNLILNLF